MLLGGLLIILMSLIMVTSKKTKLPFTQPREAQQKGGTMILMFLGMFLVGAIIGLVYLSSFLPAWGILIISLFVMGMIVLTNRFIRSKKYRII